MMQTSPLYAEHPQDVLSNWLCWRQDGPAALVVISGIEGGSVRSKGSLMAVAPDGRRSGYISGGCIDADVALRARHALEATEFVTLRYGTGSPFLDMPLPCGGAIELTILPQADETIVRTCHDRLAARKAASLPLPGLASAPVYTPKLRVRIAGRGADALALGRLVQTSGYELVLQLRDGEDVEAARQAALAPVALQSPRNLPPLADDPWTAFVLMFHDPDWESVLLKQALQGPAFYIGAVGSMRTQARRREQLSLALEDPEMVSRIRGPVGLLPSMRDASMLAISTLAEIIEAYQGLSTAPFSRTALLLLAAGRSRRFGDGDKLLADLNGKRVLEYAAGALATEALGARVAIVGPDQSHRAAILGAAHWDVVVNPEAESGQASSIRCGIQHVLADDGIDQVIILLADMPFVPDTHLQALQESVNSGATAAITTVQGIACPPVIFGRDAFAQLMALEGDAGGRSVFRSLAGTQSIELPASCAADIDTRTDLASALLAKP